MKICADIPVDKYFCLILMVTSKHKVQGKGKWTTLFWRLKIGITAEVGFPAAC